MLLSVGAGTDKTAQGLYLQSLHEWCQQLSNQLRRVRALEMESSKMLAKDVCELER